MIEMQRRLATSHQGVVLDVVVNEQFVVVRLERCGSREDRLEIASERPTQRDRQGRAEGLSFTQRVVEDQFVQMRAIVRGQGPSLHW